MISLSISQTNKALSKKSHLYASVFTLKDKLLKYSQITKIREKLCCLLHSGQLPRSEDWCLNSSISTDCWWLSNILGAAVRSFQQKELKRYDDLAHVLGTWAHLLQILCLLPSMEKYNLTSSNLFIAVYSNRTYSRRSTYTTVQALDWLYSFYFCLFIKWWLYCQGAWNIFEDIKRGDQCIWISQSRHHGFQE